jgi:hypothetical protein
MKEAHELTSYCTDYSATLPDITIYINCDTGFAVNLNRFHLNENDELIFIIKNYNYVESSYVFLHRVRVSDADVNGDIFFNIPPATSKRIKPGAFYTFAVMQNAFDSHEPTEYRKLTDNGAINLEYGAQDFLVKDAETDLDSEIIGVRMEPIADESSISANIFMTEITDIRLELIEE